ncbi:MAG: hypothetical protein H6Q05_4915 [Acidobacteria bacterium]|nr:hypothetical protein [Acidobacteriota bacterium]
MSQPRKQGQRAKTRPSGAVARRLRASIVIVIAIAAAAAIAVGFWWSQSRKAGNPPAVTEKAGARFNPALEKLIGQWQRPDGDYIIEIRSIEPDGKMNAAYFNPLPIHVEKAEVSQMGETFSIVIVLNDANYPGSTYTLSYDAARDILRGSYFQAAKRQTYGVYFIRWQQ